MRSLLLVSVIIGIAMQTGLGQTASRDATKVPSLRSHIPIDFKNAIHRVYGTEQGLPSNWVHTVLQSSDGFLWVGTHNGLARFDGVNFISHKRPRLPANDCRALLESRDGTLWIGTTGGLAKYRRGCPGTFEQIAELAKQSIRVIFEDSSGRIWVGTARKTWRSNGSTFERVAEAPNAVWSIIEDGANIWLGSDNGLYEHSGLCREIPLAENLPRPTNITQLLLEDGELLIGTNRGVMQIENDRVQFLRPAFGNNYVNHIQKIGDDTFVLADQVYRPNDGVYEVVNQLHPRFIASDHEGAVWISGIRDLKLHHYQPQPFAQMFPRLVMRAIYENQGTIWLGSNYYLHRIENGRTTRFDVPVKVAPSAGIYSICGSRDHTLWLGTAKGLFKWSSESATPVLRFEGPVTSVMEDSQGTLWFAHGPTTQTLKDGELTTIDELTSHANWFFEDDSGVWIGTRSGLFLATDQIKEIRDPSFENLNPVFTCHCAVDGTLWLGNQSGLVRYRDGQFDVFTSLDGLLADYIQQLQVDNQDNLWVGGRHGYFTVSVDQFDALLSGKIKRLACQSVEEDYGTSNLFGFAGSPSACRAQDGTTWIAAGKGVLKIPPQPIRKPSVVDVYIDHVRVDDQTVNPNKRVEFSTGPRRLAIDFSAPTFANPKRVQVKYRLDEHDADWIGAGDERTAYYTDLLPGEYEFRVIADNGHGVWNENGPSIELTVKPRWWETIWIRAVAAVGLLMMAVSWGLIYTAGIRRNNVQLRAEVEGRKRTEENLATNQLQLRNLSGRLISAQEDEKRHLARELHDDFSQRLAALAIDADALEMRMDRPTDASEIRDLRERIVDLSNDIHQVSRELHPSTIDDLGLVDALKLEFDSLCQRERISIDYQYDNIAASLTADQALCLYRIAQASVRNAIKHAGTDKLRVSLFETDGRATLTVVDEGVGFDLEKVRHTVGLGLRSMEERARLVGGELSIQSRPGHGTEVVVHVPLQSRLP